MLYSEARQALLPSVQPGTGFLSSSGGGCGPMRGFAGGGHREEIRRPAIMIPLLYSRGGMGPSVSSKEGTCGGRGGKL